MKKLFMLLAATILALTLSACGGNEDLECDENQVAVGDQCIGLDNMEDLNPDQIADLLVDEFDGGLGHLGTAMQGMNFEDSSEMTIEGNISMTENSQLMADAHLVMTSKVAMIDGKRAYYQKQEITIDGTTMMQESIMVEVVDGVDVYVNIGGFLDGLSAREKVDIESMLTAFNLNVDWVMYHFEDSLENMVELEVAKDLFLDILEDEIGPNPFNELHDQLELELDINLDAYNLSIIALGALLESSDYAGIKTYLENVDFIGLQEELSGAGGMQQSIPGIDPIAFEEAIVAMNHASFLVELQTFDFEMMVTKVSEGEAAFGQYVAGLTDFPEIQALLTPIEGFVGILEEEDVLDEIAYIAESMSDFEEYLTYQYYIDEEFLNVDVSLVNEDNVLTTATVDPTNFDNVFEDFVTEFYWFLYEFPGMDDVGYVEVLNCPANQDCEEFDAFNEVTEAVANLDPITVEFLFDPSGDKSMEMTFDGKEFMQSLADDQSNDVIVVTAANVSMTMKESASITLPTNAEDVQDAIDELVQFAFLSDLYESMRDIQENHMYMGVLDGLYTLDNYPGYNRLDNLAFDPTMSTILVSEGEVIFTLYWRDGSMVLNAPINGYEISTLVEDNINTPDFGRSHLLAIIGELNQSNFSNGKAVVYLLMD